MELPFLQSAELANVVTVGAIWTPSPLSIEGRDLGGERLVQRLLTASQEGAMRESALDSRRFLVWDGVSSPFYERFPVEAKKEGRRVGAPRYLSQCVWLR